MPPDMKSLAPGWCETQVAPIFDIVFGDDFALNSCMSFCVRSNLTLFPGECCCLSIPSWIENDLLRLRETGLLEVLGSLCSCIGTILDLSSTVVSFERDRGASRRWISMGILPDIGMRQAKKEAH